MNVKQLMPLDFNDPYSDVNIAIYAIIIAFLFVLLTYLIISLIRRNETKKYITLENTRTYIINFSKAEITYFDQNNLHKLNLMPIEKFYEQFTDSSLINVKEWIENLLTSKSDAPFFIEAHIKLKSKSTEFALLEVTSVNPQDQIIHIDSHLLPRLSPSNSKHSGRRHIVSYEGLSAKFNQLLSSGTKRGAASLIRIRTKQSAIAKQTQNSVNAVTLQIVNALTPYLTATRCIAFTGGDEFLLFDSLVQNRSQFFSLANEVVKKINAFFVVSSLDDEFGVALGATLIDFEVKDLKHILSRCRTMSELAEKIPENPIVLYEKDSNKVNNTLGQNKYADITSIIRNRSLRYYYTPIVAAADASIYGYFTKIRPFGTDMDYEELLQVSQECNLLSSLEETIFSDLDKAIRHSETIITKASIPMLNCLIKEKPVLNPASFTLSLNHKSLDVVDDLIDDLHSMLRSAKELGFKLALYFNEMPESTLDSNDISLFDAFIISRKLTSGIKNDNRIQADFRLLISTYSIYQKPIIISGLTSPADLEIALANNTQFFTSDFIAMPSSTFEILDAETAKKVVTLYEQYN